ncbi:hypothetical protein [Kitasatospora sp. NPDC004289]
MHAPFRHPLARHAAGTVLGFRADGRPIYPIAGGNGEGEGAAAGTPAAPAAEPQTPAAPVAEPPKPGPPPASPAAPAGESDADKIARLERDLTAARGEAAKDRTTAKANAAQEARNTLAQEIGKALGLVKDDTPPDPAKLAEQISTQTGRIGELETALRQRDVELAVHTAAEKHGAKTAALLDSRAFAKAISALDPAAKNFATELDTAIKTAVEANPNFRTVPQAGRSGTDLSGGTGEATTKQRPTSLGAALKSHYGTT